MATDMELLEAWRGGDAAAGNALFDRHFDALERFFRNKVGREEASDLIQKTFMVCIEKRDEFRGDASLRTYVFAVAHNLLRNHIRAQQRAARRHVPDPVSVHDMNPGASTCLARQQEHQILLQALRRIPVEHQIMLELFYWENMEGKDLARVMDVPLGTVKSRLRRAKQLLEQAIGELSDSPEQLRETLTRLEDWARELRDHVLPAPAP